MSQEQGVEEEVVLSPEQEAAARADEQAAFDEAAQGDDETVPGEQAPVTVTGVAAGEAPDAGTPEPAAAADATGAADVGDDDIPPAVKRLLDQQAEQLKKQAEQLATVDQLAKTAAGRAAALQSALDKAKATAGDAPTATQARAAIKSSEKFAALKKQFPEWGEAIEEQLQVVIQSELESGRSSGQEGLSAEQIENRATARALGVLSGQLVESAHRGWRTTIKTPEFDAWFNAQPPEVKALERSDFYADAIELLDLYEDARKSSGATQASAATGSPSRQGRRPSSPQERLRRAIPATGGKVVRPPQAGDTEQSAFEREFQRR